MRLCGDTGRARANVCRNKRQRFSRIVVTRRGVLTSKCSGGRSNPRTEEVHADEMPEVREGGEEAEEQPGAAHEEGGVARFPRLVLA